MKSPRGFLSALFLFFAIAGLIAAATVSAAGNGHTHPEPKAGKGPYSANGLIRACVKVRSHGRGQLRLVRRSQGCRNGERKVRWASGPGATSKDGSAGP